MTKKRNAPHLLICLTLIGTSFAFVPPTESAHTQPTHAASSLPSDRLEFGLSNLDATWMNASGIPWRYRFQYLAGGVNTPGNWLTWQDPAKPPGQFALDYMTASTTAPANYIPVFTWYQLLQSTPSIGTSELARDYSNLNTAATMASYYASFKVLMQKAGQYGNQVVVHVEPDFWAYMQQKAAGAGASTISAMVHSSGFPEAAAFPDTLVGFTSELKYLRDTYAPNALLAMHASMWSSGVDLSSDTRTSIDPVAEADSTAAFLNSAGAAVWDAVFNDVDDHNAAWWELASCSTPPCVNQFFTHWWDTSNVKFPNFNRYLGWVGELRTKTGVPQVAWQVPMGNQYFLTMNNTCGHYQDNVAPYFIAHASGLFSAGLVAVLFGPGNSCQTSYDDAQHDGVTNNNGASTTDQLGGCNACNTNVSSWADDDGGYLRIFVGRYYAGQSSCLTVALNATPSSPRASGTQVAVSAMAAGCPNPQYQFWTLAPGSSTWQVAQPYSPSATFSWHTTLLAGGAYSIAVWARDASSAGIYGNAIGRWDAFRSMSYSLVTPICSALRLSASPPVMSAVGTSATFAASGTCPDPNPVYQFWTRAPGANGWTVVQPYSAVNTFTWTTTNKAPGNYQIAAWVRDANSPGAYSNIFGTWDLVTSQPYTLTTCTGLTLAAPAWSIGVSGSVTFTANATGCPTSNPAYQFWVHTPGATAWTVVQPYSAVPTFTWSTAGSVPGAYQVAVWVRDASSAGASSNIFGSWDLVTSHSFAVTTCGGLSLSHAAAGNTVTVAAAATGCPSPSPMYQFWMQAPGTNTWTVVQPYSSSSTFTWNTTGLAKGDYQVAVWVRDANSVGAFSNTFGSWDVFASSTLTL